MTDWAITVIGTSMCMAPSMGFPPAIILSANFLANQAEGSFRAVASFVKRGQTVSIVRTILYGTGNKVIADVTTTHVLLND